MRIFAIVPLRFALITGAGRYRAATSPRIFIGTEIIIYIDGLASPHLPGSFYHLTRTIVPHPDGIPTGLAILYIARVIPRSDGMPHHPLSISFRDPLQLHRSEPNRNLVGITRSYRSHLIHVQISEQFGGGHL